MNDRETRMTIHALRHYARNEIACGLKSISHTVGTEREQEGREALALANKMDAALEIKMVVDDGLLRMSTLDTRERWTDE
jgi:hypothetical protein